MIAKKELLQLLFIDIETIPKYPSYELFHEKEPRLSFLFMEKMHKLDNIGKGLSRDDLYEKFAPLYPEFSRIVSISWGSIKDLEGDENFTFFQKNVTDEDECIILEEFKAVLVNLTNKRIQFKFCGHNIDGFDLPFIIKRMLINKIQVPTKLRLYDIKPWDFPTLDTMKIWKNGSYEHTGLNLLCAVLDINSPKESGVESTSVGKMYFSDDEERLVKIKNYCNLDVMAVMEIMLTLYKGYHVA